MSALHACSAVLSSGTHLSAIAVRTAKLPSTQLAAAVVVAQTTNAIITRNIVRTLGFRPAMAPVCADLQNENCCSCTHAIRYTFKARTHMVSPLRLAAFATPAPISNKWAATFSAVQLHVSKPTLHLGGLPISPRLGVRHKARSHVALSPVAQIADPRKNSGLSQNFSFSFVASMPLRAKWSTGKHFKLANVSPRRAPVRYKLGVVLPIRFSISGRDGLTAQYAFKSNIKTVPKIPTPPPPKYTTDYTPEDGEKTTLKKNDTVLIKPKYKGGGARGAIYKYVSKKERIIGTAKDEIDLGAQNYASTKRPRIWDQVPQPKKKIDQTRGLKKPLSIGFSGSFAPVRVKELKCEIKVAATFVPRFRNVSLEAVVFWSPLFGWWQQPTEPLRARPIMTQVASRTSRLILSQKHELFKKRLQEWGYDRICAKTTVKAPLTGPPGLLTKITKAQKARLEMVPHPDNNKPLSLDEFLGGMRSRPKKYMPRLVVTPKNDPPCACEFMHVGLYNVRDGVWGFNQERPVLLMLPYSELFPAGLFKLPVPNVWPQFNECGEYRVVMVKNLMYDLYPPVAFVRGELEGRQQPRVVNRTVIDTEVSRLVIVRESCGNSFFLVNAECA